MKRRVPSPKRRGLYNHAPHQIDTQLSELCPEAIGVSSASARLMIERINTEHANRYLHCESAGDQLELVRLEALRVKIMASVNSKSNANEVSPQHATPISAESLTSNGEPGPTVPNSTRTSIPTPMPRRAAILSESEISVLDLGPSLHSTHFSARSSRRNSSSANDHNGIGLARTTAPSFVPGPSSDTSDRPVEHRLRTDELESVALTSASGSINNEFPLNLRQRRQNRPNITLPSSHDLRPRRVNRSSTVSEAHGLRDRFGFDHSPISFIDEPNRRIHSLSVPQFPQSPPLPPHPTLQRSQSSSNGMEQIFSDLRNAERAKRNARNSVGSREADRI